jgi:hypothetical protein
VINVILLYPDGQRKEVILEGVPQKGDTIRLVGDRVALIVEHRLWMESGGGGNAPATLISVRPVPD